MTPPLSHGRLGGFSAIVGNPPFLGGKRVSTTLGVRYRDWLSATGDGTSNNADLVAYFFRGAFEHLRTGGTLGLVATNTIAQGDTRTTGLRWIRVNGGVVYDANRSVPWPGRATVVVSIVHVQRAPTTPPAATLDGEPVASISAFLSDVGSDDDPVRLADNAGKAFIGCFLRGMGFTFADGDPAATPLAEMRRLVRDDPRNAARIHPYLGGDELNSTVDKAPSRFVIRFGSMTLEQAREWPSLLAIVEAKVRPERAKLGDNAADRAHKRSWWRFANDRLELGRATAHLSRVLVTARVSHTLAFAFVPSSVVPSEQLVVFAFDRWAALAVLQSRVHELWARRFSSTLGEGLRYTPSDCFETFPWPRAWEGSEALELAGRAYDEHRRDVMVRRGEGLTRSFNRFHDRDDSDADIVALRTLHDAMDRAVVDAYGWTDLAQASSFGEERGRVRYGWSTSLVDEVLRRLLALNAARSG